MLIGALPHLPVNPYKRSFMVCDTSDRMTCSAVQGVVHGHVSYTLFKTPLLETLAQEEASDLAYFR
jgi:hypothetical protein